MDLRDFLRPFLKYKVLVLVFLAVSVGLGYLYTNSLPVKYRASTTVLLFNEPEAPTKNYFTYEGFYAQKAAQEYTDTVVGLLRSDVVLSAVQEKVFREENDSDRGDLRQLLKVEKHAPQLMQVSVTWEDSQQARKIVEAVVASGREKLIEDHGKQSGLSMIALLERPLVEEVETSLILNLLVAGGLGFIFAVGLIWIREYLLIS